MKKSIILIAFVVFSLASQEQVLLEDKTGDALFSNTVSSTSNLALIKLNTGDQSLGLRYILSTALVNPASYKIQEFGIQAKPTEGYAAVIGNGQFSPGVRLSYALTRVTLFSNKAGYTDWGSINVGYDINKYSLYKPDTTFSNQFYSQSAKALSLTFNYNALINSIWIVSVKAGYSRRNNYDDLAAIEAKDIKSVTDVASNTERQVIKTRTAHQGSLSSYDAYPLVISVTKATPTDPIGSANAARLKIGYTVYLKTLASNNLPKTDAGVLFFLTKQAANGVRSPVFGINVQASDPFDVKNQNNGLDNRISVGFTTVFSL